MTARLLEGKPLAQALMEEARSRAQALSDRRGSPPRLAALTAGADPATQLFLRRKLEACGRAGIDCTVEALPASQNAALRVLEELGEAPLPDGLVLELPLPEGLDARRLRESISPEKDVEGVTPLSLGRLFGEKSREGVQASGAFVPCTAQAAVDLILAATDPRGKEAVVVGRSGIVGRPAAHLLSCLDATVTLCHSRTAALSEHLKRADIVVTAVGRPRWIPADWLKPGAVVVDAGISASGGAVCGDVDFEAARAVAGAITPVPGGVGPLTIAHLLYNTVLAAERRSA